MEGKSSSIEIYPERLLADEPVTIKLYGFEPRQRITVRATLTDDSGIHWLSQAIFASDDKGHVDLSRHSAIEGSYRGMDRMGLFWSMRPAVDKRRAGSFAKNTSKPDIVTISAEVSGQPAISKTIKKVYLAPGVERKEIKEGGLIGTFFRSAGSDPQPGIIILGGTVGGLKEDMAAILASRGFATLALAYFGLPGLPSEYANIPLEYFEKGIEWMQKNGAVLGDRLAVLGRSRGGELALLIGATLKSIKAVISFAGSGVVFQGLKKDGGEKEAQSAWSWRGQPIPFVPFKAGLRFILKAIWAQMAGKPIATKLVHEEGMKDTSAMERATISVENISGPVLLISGEKDTVWPSSRLSQIAVDRFKNHHHSFYYNHISYKNAGHGIGLPYRPTTVTRFVDARGRVLNHGGDPLYNAHANEAAWNETLKFLDKALRQ